MELAKENGNNMMTKLLKLTGLLAVAAVIIIVVGYFTLPPDYESLSFPGGKSFAFTICDDTDLSTVDNVKPMYDLLHQLGLRTTKTVWVLPTNDTTNWANRGETLSDSAYADFVLELKAKDFEIGYHGSRGGNSRRDETIQALWLRSESDRHNPPLQGQSTVLCERYRGQELCEPDRDHRRFQTFEAHPLCLCGIE